MVVSSIGSGAKGCLPGLDERKSMSEQNILLLLILRLVVSHFYFIADIYKLLKRSYIVYYHMSTSYIKQYLNFNP